MVFTNVSRVHSGEVGEQPVAPAAYARSMPEERTPDTPPSRRERLRQETVAEIIAAAREIIGGGRELSLREVAERVGMTPPGLYRYVDSLAALDALVGRAIFDSVVEEMRRTAEPFQGDPVTEVVLSAVAFRTWALARPAEFRHVFASGDPDDRLAAHEHGASCGLGCDSLIDDGSDRFGQFFAEKFHQLVANGVLTLPAAEELPPGLTAMLIGSDPKSEMWVSSAMGAPDPALVWVFQRAWVRIYGIVGLEAFGHVHRGLVDSGALFFDTLVSTGRDLGIELDAERTALVMGLIGVEPPRQ